MPRRVVLSNETQQEIVALYEQGNNVEELRTTYGLSLSTLYRVLSDNGIHRRRKSFVTTVAELPATIPYPVPTEIVTPLDIPALPTSLPMRVTTDGHGYVQSTEREQSRSVRLHTWEVRFESAMRVEAATITEAISEVQKLPMCRRVFNVALKGAP